MHEVTLASLGGQVISTPKSEKTAFQALLEMRRRDKIPDFINDSQCPNTGQEIARLKRLMAEIESGRLSVKRMALEEAYLYHRSVNAQYLAITRNVRGDRLPMDQWSLTEDQRQSLRQRGFQDRDLDTCYLEMLLRHRQKSAVFPMATPAEHSRKFMAFLANIRPGSASNWTIEWPKLFMYQEGGSMMGRVKVSEIVSLYRTKLLKHRIPNRIARLEKIQERYEGRSVSLGERRSDWYYDRSALVDSGVIVSVDDYQPSQGLRDAAIKHLGLSNEEINEITEAYRTLAHIRLRDVAKHELALSRFLFRSAPRPKDSIGKLNKAAVGDALSCSKSTPYVIVESLFRRGFVQESTFDFGFDDLRPESDHEDVLRELASRPNVDPKLLDRALLDFLEEKAGYLSEQQRNSLLISSRSIIQRHRSGSGNILGGVDQNSDSLLLHSLVSILTSEPVRTFAYEGGPLAAIETRELSAEEADLIFGDSDLESREESSVPDWRRRFEN